MIHQLFEAPGNIAKDAEMRYTPGGVPVASVNVGVNDGYMKGEEWINRTMWVTLSVWGNSAEKFVEKAKKGLPIFFRGKLTYNDNGSPRTYEQNGETRAKFEVKVDEYQIFGKSGGGTIASGKVEYAPIVEEESELPF
jgi:single-strand DNA-binding protein